MRNSGYLHNTRPVRVPTAMLTALLIAPAAWSQIEPTAEVPPAQEPPAQEAVVGGAAAEESAEQEPVTDSATGQEPETPPQSAQAASGPIEEVVITGTGTRITGFDAPTPLTEVGAEQLQEKAVQRMAELMVDVPAFSTNQNIGRTSGPIGASSFDLRGLGATRTLVLLDGRRVAPTEPAGTIDANIIPVSLIKQIEIVTGGASAAYGSDAVSGVVNITLDDEFEGVRGDVQYGISGHNDVESAAASSVFGHSFIDGRLHWVGALDYYDNNGQLRQDSRPWGDDDYALIANPNGRPNLVRAANARFSQLTDGGVASLNNHAALKGIQFGPGGQVLPFNYGTMVGSTYMVGGDGGTLADSANVFPMLERRSAFTRASFDFSDSLSVYADALYSNLDAFSDSAFKLTNRAPLGIKRDNAFLPKQVLDLMIANNVQTFNLGRIIKEGGHANSTIDNTVERYGLGIEGKFGSSWKWDASAQLSRNQYDRLDGNNMILNRFSLGVDSVVDPATGQPICRARLNDPTSTNPDIALCVPVNVFGAGSISQAAVDYFNGTAVLNSQQEQMLYGVNLQGRPFQTWAGDVSVAVGAEHRKDEIEADSDAVSQRGGWFSVNAKPLAGDVSVNEVYTEVAVPLLADRPFGYLLDVNAAVRLTDYSTSGRVTTWKAGANYSPVANLRFRGTYSRDIRAPSINELFSGQSQSVTNLFDPRDNTNPTVPQFTGGNPDLTPEISSAWTTGVVYEPTWLNGLRLSFDYYSFEIEDAITALTGQQVVDGCFKLSQAALCDSITLNADGRITQVSAILINAASITTEGFDIEAAYGLPIFSGMLDIRLLATYVDNLTTTINGVGTDLVNQLGTESAGGVPDWRVVTSARYSTDSFGAGATVRYINSGLNRANLVSGIDIDDNTIPSRTYVDLDFSAQATEYLELYAKVNNLFDVEPPLAPSNISEPSYNSGAFHDLIGRYFKVGVRFEF